MTLVCVSKLAIIRPDNGLSPGWRLDVMGNNAGVLFMRILSEIHSFSFKKMHLNILSAKWRPCCLGLNILIHRTPPWGNITSSSHLLATLLCLNIAYVSDATSIGHIIWPPPQHKGVTTG